MRPCFRRDDIGDCGPLARHNAGRQRTLLSSALGLWSAPARSGASDEALHTNSNEAYCETVWITLDSGRALVIVVGSFGSWPIIASYSGSVSSVALAFIATTL